MPLATFKKRKLWDGVATPPASAAKTSEPWSDTVITAVYASLDRDMYRECEGRRKPAPATCRVAGSEQSVATRIYEALGSPAIGSEVRITREVVAKVAPIAHEVVATTMVDAGILPSVIGFTRTDWHVCTPYTQAEMVSDLTKAIGLKPIRAW